MGFKEKLIEVWIDKTIKYQEKKFYILDQFEFENKEYLCGCNIETLNNENLEVVFFYKIKDDIFGHVEEDKLFDDLLMHISGRMIANEMKEIFENNKDKFLK